MKRNGSGSVLVVGGGIAGIQASLDLAEAGFRVHLVEKSPTIGGIMAQLDKTFPTNDCAMCIMSPKLVDCARHLNINLLTLSEVEEISGNPGDFTVRIRKYPRYIDEDKCTGCGECEKYCPVEMPDEFNERLSTRKAIYRPFPQAAPNVFTIEKKGKSPCSAACPAGCNAHGYVALIRERKFDEAVKLIRERIPLPAICGRVCGLCEDECNRANLDQAIQIRALKRFASDWEMRQKQQGIEPDVESTKVTQNREKVAIIGSGPAGLTAAYDLAKEGFRPVIFEARKKAGGMLRYGIPRYRLPEDVIDYEVEIIRKTGVEIKYNSPFGKNLTTEKLKSQGFKAVFIAAGTQKSRRLGIKGEELEGVYPAVELLRDITEGKHRNTFTGKRVAVIGGGNTAIDSVRTMLRLGAREAFIVYRRRREEMPALEEEIVEAEAEGAGLKFLLSPKEITGKKGKASELICNRMRLGFPDSTGRRRPVPVEGETESFAVDAVITALGQEAEDTVTEGASGKLNLDRGLFRVDPITLETGEDGVFAGGDIAGAGGLVVHAIAHGHAAAESIQRYLEGRDLREGRDELYVETALTPEEYRDRKQRLQVPKADMKKRLSGFDEVEIGFDDKQAVEEAMRCLNCGVCSECLQCVSNCEADAIDHSMKEESIELKVGSVLLATGCEKYDPSAMYHLGFGKYPDVVTSIQFERILSASGPFSGHIKRLSNGKTPEKIAFIQCVGSRDLKIGNEHCSSVCCMYAIKEAVIAREHEKQIEPTIFYMDIRAHGKDFDRYFERSKQEYGVRFIKARVSGVEWDKTTGKLLVRYEDDKGKTCFEDFDMVVLSVGFEGGESILKLSEALHIPLNCYGFIASDPFNPVETKVPGYFICGPAQEPKDIPETIMQASAGAAAASEVLAETRWTEIEEKRYPPEKDVAGQELRIGVFVCHCGINIGGIVDVPDVTEYVKTLPGVVYAEDNLYTCSQDTQEHIKEIIKEHNLNRVVVASCTPRTHEALFQETIREAGLNRHLFEMANIRDQCSWIHMNFPREATEKAKDLLRMTVAKARLIEPLPSIPLDVNQKALVIGGGPAGMSAALSLANQGFSVELVEKEAQLGGNLRKLLRTVDGGETQPLIKRMISSVTNHRGIIVHVGTQVQTVEGFVGNFKTTLSGNSKGPITIEHGAVVIATGARESVPREYLYGEDARIKTGLEFETFLEQTPSDNLPERVAFIQCVGSREKGHLYCSRVCCMETVKNALYLKKQRPSSEVYVLYRDMRTYGFSERYYREARESGVVFIRYNEDEKPLVEKKNHELQITVTDTLTGDKVEIFPQILVLASRIDPGAENELISQQFKVPLGENGFFLEAHVKLRPVDFATEGVFLAGMAHNPKTLSESITQGKAAAARAATILSKSKYEAEPTIAAVNEDLCDGCGICVGVCEYKALEVVERQEGGKVVKLNEAICKGCGCCVAACPSGAMEQKGFKSDQILAEIDALLG